MQLAHYVMGREPFRLATTTTGSSSELATSTQAINLNPQPNTLEPQNANNYALQQASTYPPELPSVQHQSISTTTAATSDWLINSAKEATSASPYEHYLRSSKSADFFVRLNQTSSLHRTTTQHSSPIGLTLAKLEQAATTKRDSIPNGSFEQSDFSDLIVRYVDLSLVRNMIAQYIIEIAFISVILIYLFYYFRKISQCPKLIGNENSDLFKLVKENLNDVLSHRFSPLVYFWGTNPQTALFGYLQGNSSEKEMPRSKFKRQYLYVSDVQYLTSNVNLNEHYPKLGTNQRRPLVQLNANDLIAPPPIISLLDQNIRLVLESMARNTSKSASIPSTISERSCATSNSDAINAGDGSESPSSVEIAPVASFALDLKSSESASDIKSSSQSNAEQQVEQRPLSYCGDEHYKDKPLGSSSGDSGVFGASNSSSSVSSSSSSLTINLESSSEFRCNCTRLYRHNSIERYDFNRPTNRADTMTSDCDNYQHSNQINLNNSDNNKSNQVPISANDKQQVIERERFEFGQCAVDWFQDSHKNYHRNKLVALISAGMTTGSDKKYVTDTVTTLSELGYEVCVFIRRGVGGLKLSSARFFSPSKWRDFEAAIHSIRQQRPNARLVAIGFSFGSIELCRYLSMSGERSLVDSALLVSCPFDPEAGGRNMQRRALNRRIDAYLAKNLGKQLYQALFSTSDAETLSRLGIGKDSSFTNQNGSMIDLASLPKIKSLVDFEDNYNRVIQNYPNSQAYAADSRLHEHLKAIKTPTLCLSSEDDFMAPKRLLPLEQIKNNQNICMILTKRGGHMAFIDGLLWPTKPYFAQRIINKYMGAFKESNNGQRTTATLTVATTTTAPISTKKNSSAMVAINYDFNFEKQERRKQRQQQTIAQENKLHHIVQVYR